MDDSRIEAYYKSLRISAIFARISLVTGILLVAFSILLIVVSFAAAFDYGPGPNFADYLYLIFYFISFLGIMCGVYGLHSKKKAAAITGIILCFLVLAPYIIGMLNYTDFIF
jgi:hypothetical protein